MTPCRQLLLLTLATTALVGCTNSCARTSGEEPARAALPSAAPREPRRVEAVEIPSLPALASNSPPETIPAQLYLPEGASVARRAPAMIIVVSSGCVVEAREPYYARDPYYARELARVGIAGLVVDSCSPRGVRSTVDDQTRMSAWAMENDAWAALVFLARDPRIDSKRIGIMGVSKGGTVAMHTALLVRRRWQGARVPRELSFAAQHPRRRRHARAQSAGNGHIIGVFAQERVLVRARRSTR